MKKIAALPILMLLLFVFLGAAASVSAEGLVKCSGDDCNLCNLFQTIMGIVDYCIKTLIPLIAVLLIAWGGFRMVINQNNSDVANQTKAIITAAVVGLAIIYGGWAVVDMFMQGMNYNANGGKWYNVPCSMIQVPATVSLREISHSKTEVAAFDNIA